MDQKTPDPSKQKKMVMLPNGMSADTVLMSPSVNDYLTNNNNNMTTNNGGNLFNMHWGSSMGASLQPNTLNAILHAAKQSGGASDQTSLPNTAGFFGMNPLLLESNGSTPNIQGMPWYLPGVTSPSGGMSPSGPNLAPQANALLRNLEPKNVLLQNAQSTILPSPNHNGTAAHLKSGFQQHSVSSRSSARRAGTPTQVQSFLPVTHSVREGSNREAWNEAEDAKLIQIVKATGPKRWSHIARVLGTGRSSKQCRERWSNQINPELIRDKWTAEEDSKILELHKKHGNRWALIATALPGRTDNMIKNRFNGSLKARTVPKRGSRTPSRSTVNRARAMPIIHVQSVSPVKRDRGVTSESRSNKRRKMPRLEMTSIDGLAKDAKTTPPARHAGRAKITPQECKVILSSTSSHKGDWNKIEYELEDRTKGSLFWNPKEEMVSLSPPNGEQMPPGALRVTKAKLPPISSVLLKRLEAAGKNQASLRASAAHTPWEKSTSACHCKRSRCLKLYCECFASEKHCSPSCKCVECQNVETSSEWATAFQKCINRNPNFFRKEGTATSCKCKNTRCLKKYCDCFRTGNSCGIKCKCISCMNK